MMESIISTVGKIAKVNIRNDDDILDRLHHRYTVIFLIIFTVLISTTQYVGTPIHCWCPAYFTGNHEEFTNKMCWISNTYYLPQKAVAGAPGTAALKQHIGYYQWVPVILLLQAFLFFLPSLLWTVFCDRSGKLIKSPKTNTTTVESRIFGTLYTVQNFNSFSFSSYYQWVPVILLTQAFLFYIPCLVWRIASDRSGINVNNLVEAAETIQNALYPERRDKTIKYMIRHLDHYLDYQREYRGGCCVAMKHFLARHLCLICGNRYGNYLVTLYLSTKVLYFINVMAQLFLMNVFLGTDYHLYGFEVIRDLARGIDWSASRRFPRVTLCDFQIRQMGNVHRHTVQCVLPINLFNEKIYIFLWFWFVFVAAATCFGFLRWIWTIGFRYSRIRYIRKHLKIMDKLNRDSDRDKKLSHKFAEMYLRQDGVFVLKLVAKNSTDLVVADIVAALWDNYKSKPMNVRPDTDIDDTTSLA